MVREESITEPLIEIERTSFCPQCEAVKHFYYHSRVTDNEVYLNHVYKCDECGLVKIFDTSKEFIRRLLKVRS